MNEDHARAGKQPPPQFQSPRAPSCSGKTVVPAYAYNTDDIDDESDESSSGSGALPMPPIIGQMQTPISPPAAMHPALRLHHRARQTSEQFVVSPEIVEQHKSLFMKHHHPSIQQQHQVQQVAHPPLNVLPRQTPNQVAASRRLASDIVSGDNRRVFSSSHTEAVTTGMARQQLNLLTSDTHRGMTRGRSLLQHRGMVRGGMGRGGAVHIPMNEQTMTASTSSAHVIPANQEVSTTSGEVGKVYDPLGNAGIDMRSERMKLNVVFTEPSGVHHHQSRVLSTAQTEQEQYSLKLDMLIHRIGLHALKVGLRSVQDGVPKLICLAVQERLKNLIDCLIEASKLRVDSQKLEYPIRVTSEPHHILKRIQKSEEYERDAREAREKARLLEDAKLRKGDDNVDDETARQIVKAQAEDDQRRKAKETNDALSQMIGDNAIFQFKKKESSSVSASLLSKKLAAAAEASKLPPSSVGVRTLRRNITLVDCLNVFQQDGRLRKTDIIYKSYLKLGSRTKPRR